MPSSVLAASLTAAKKPLASMVALDLHAADTTRRGCTKAYSAWAVVPESKRGEGEGGAGDVQKVGLLPHSKLGVDANHREAASDSELLCALPLKRSSSAAKLTTAAGSGASAVLKLAKSRSQPALLQLRSEKQKKSDKKRQPASTAFASFLPPLLTEPPLRIGIYVDTGTHGSPTRFTIRSAVASTLREAGCAFCLENLKIADVQTSLSRKNFDIVIFPGGRGDHIAELVGPSGLAAVRNFVAEGGGYIGTCAGSVLGIKHLGLVGDLPTKQPWARGRGDVDVEFTDTGLAALKLPTDRRCRSIFYGQGPIVDEGDLPASAEILAYFRTEVCSRYSEQTEGQMINTPAVIGVPYGSGKVIVNACHPESMTPPMEDIYAGFLSYVAPPVQKTRDDCP